MTAVPPVLAATDFSPPAEQAVRRAAHLAHELGAPLVLVHVHEPPVLGEVWRQLQAWVPGVSGVDAQALQQSAQTRLQAAAQAVVTEGGGPVEARLLEGRAAAAVAAEAAACGAQLVVIGARGEHGLAEVVLGSTAERLLHGLACDLLLVRASGGRPYERMLLPTDFGPESRQALRRLRRLLPTVDSVLLHAYELPYENKLAYAGVEAARLEDLHRRAQAELQLALQALARAVGHSDLPSACKVVHGYAPAVIAAEAEALGVDLIALSAGSRSTLERVVLGSVCLHLALESPCDLWLVRSDDGGDARCP
jgi:nucleotide-binding universal stress UspA family protein